jgi:hypothetical protein
MLRRTKLLLAASTLLAIGMGIGVWLAFFPPWASPALEKRLLGSWEGSGKVSGDMSIDIPPGQAIPAVKTTDKVTTACAVQAEFKPDGTYTWKEQHQGEGISMNFWVPKEDGPPARWEVVGAQGNSLTVRIHSGEVVFAFQDENSFTMSLPESAKGSGTITFRRSGPSKK